MEQHLLTSQEVADLLRISEGTLRNWRYTGLGPPYVKMHGRLVRYREGDVQAYIDALPTNPPANTKRGPGLRPGPQSHSNP